jgi:hypothetical protein
MHAKSQINLSAYYVTLNHPTTDSFLSSNNNYGNYHLIGTYPGWDKSAIYIAGYNNTNMPSVSTQKVIIGQNIKFDLTQNSLEIGTLNTQGLLIGRYKDRLNWDGTGAQPGYYIRFAGYRDCAGDFTGAAIGALRTNLCCDALSQGMELSFSVSNRAEWKTNGDVNLIEAMRINDNGNVAIGKVKAQSKLDVAGTILAEEIQVKAATTAQLKANDILANNVNVQVNGQTADFVFNDAYKLRNLQDVETYINQNNHLPDVPSADEMESNGVNLAEMNKLLLQKIEELTLYVIQQQKEIDNLKNKTNK